MAKQYTIVKREGTTLLYAEKDGDKDAVAKKLNLQGFLYQGLRKGLTIVFKGLPQAKNLRVLRADGNLKALTPDVPVDTLPVKAVKKPAAKTAKAPVKSRSRVTA
ncbi:hypothetical protein G173_gp035 [Erwinia phage phiEaH2]|uniref:Uncharacterized protein n=1 Tax=Erwinia phage phiEaH2 TaxID=1029988 RepID=J7KKF5_9CAUD|nr:hypothetical protein G173_gp035 [Erwinia phage phiEaH2]AFQ96580.1 hypothetical protein [Erwinia phage phiEaH2]